MAIEESLACPRGGNNRQRAMGQKVAGIGPAYRLMPIADCPNISGRYSKCMVS